jgi:hypothetical protein
MPLSKGTISDGARCAGEQRADFCGRSRYVFAQFPIVRPDSEAPRLLRATLSRRRRCRCRQTQKIGRQQQLIQATLPRVTPVALYRSASGLLQLRSQHRTDDMSTRHQQIITKILVSAAIAPVLWVGCAVPATAAPDSGRTDPNPFAGLDCSCQEKYPARSPEQREEIDRGIRDGLSAWSPRGCQRPAQSTAAVITLPRRQFGNH